jgi:hypothetical protein
VAQLPVRVAGVPAIRLDGSDLDVADEEGQIGTWSDLGSADGAEDQVIRWHASRATRGPIRVAYRAAPRVVDASAADGHPPADLRTEAGGVTGPGRAFLALPPLAEQLEVHLRWVLAGGRSQARACSFGAGDLDLGPMPLEALLDCHFMAGAVSTVQHPQSPVSVHYLTRSVFNVAAFADHTAQMTARWLRHFSRARRRFVSSCAAIRTGA